MNCGIHNDCHGCQLIVLLSIPTKHHSYFTIFFKKILSILDHFQVIKKIVIKKGFEPLRTRGWGYPDLSGSTTKR